MSTIDVVDIEPALDPDVALLIFTIDAALSETTGRTIVSADHMTDLLLDIRVAALALR